MPPTPELLAPALAVIAAAVGVALSLPRLIRGPRAHVTREALRSIDHARRIGRP